MAIIAPEVNSEPIPGVRSQSPTTETTFGGGPGVEAINQQVQKVSETAANLEETEKIRADEIAANDAKAKLSATYNDLLTNPTTGVLASKGIDALPAQDVAMQSFKKTANDIGSNLKGPIQTGIFNQAAQSMYREFTNHSNMHVMQQINEHQEKSFNSLVMNETQRGATAYGNPRVSRDVLDGLIQSTEVHAKYMGLDADETEKLKMNVSSNYHEQTINQMLADPRMAPMAKQYFDSYKDQIDLGTRERIDKTLNEGQTRYAAQSSVQDILGKSENESDALKATDSIEDADTRDMARKMISAKFQQDRTAQRNDQDQLFMQWGKRVSQSGVTDPIDIRNSIPANVWSQLRNDQRTALMKSGEDTVTSPKKWLDFMDTVKDGDVTKLSRAELEEKYLPYFDSADKKRAEDIWVSGKKKGDPRFLNAQSTQQRVESALVNSGLIHAQARSRGNRDSELIKQFSSDVVSQIDQFEASQGRSPKPEEIQQIVDNRTRQYFADNKVKVAGNLILPNPQKPVSLLTDAEKGSTYVPYSSVPPKDASTLETLMRQNNKPVTKDKVERAYAAYIQGDKKRLREVINGN